MPTFAPRFPEQLALLERGVVDFHVRARARGAPRGVARERPPLRVKAGFDPDAPRPAPRPHASCCRRCGSSRTWGTRPSSSSATSRRWSATRPARTRAARGSRARRSNRSAETYLAQAFKVLDREQGRAPAQQRVARQDDDGRRRRADGASTPSRGCSSARTSRQRFAESARHPHARVPLPAPAGLRLGRARVRRRARRDRPALQPARRARPHGQVRQAPADRDDDAHPRGDRRAHRERRRSSARR